jgi:hypothetical protein
MKKKMISTVTVGLVLSGVTGMGLSAGLASPAGAATPSAVTSSGTAAHHPLRAWLRAHRKAVARDTVQISARTIGVTPKALVSTLRSGQSIAAVAQTHDVDPQTVVSALVQTADTKVNGAVTNGKLTSAQATKIEAALPGAVTKIVDHVFAQHAG